MHSRLEKPIIREERAETSAALLIKFAFSIARSNKWKPKSEFRRGRVNLRFKLKKKKFEKV